MSVVTRNVTVLPLDLPLFTTETFSLRTIDFSLLLPGSLPCCPLWQQHIPEEKGQELPRGRDSASSTTRWKEGSLRSFHVHWVCGLNGRTFWLFLGRQQSPKGVHLSGLSKVTQQQLYWDPRGCSCAQDKLVAATWLMMVQWLAAWSIVQPIAE